MIEQVKKIYALLDRPVRLGLVGLFGLILMSALLEMAGIGMFIPLLHVLSDQERVDAMPVIGDVYDAWAGRDPNRFIVVFSALLFGFFVAKNIILGVAIYLQNRFIHRERARFAGRLLAAYLARPYIFHLQRNTAELVRNVTVLSSRLFLKGVMPMVTMAMEALTAAAVLGVLFLVHPGVTVAVVLLIGLTVAVFHGFIRHRVREWGRQTVRYDGEILLWANQALNSVKAMRLAGTAPFFVEAFSARNAASARYQALSNTAGYLPRLFIEAVAMGGLSFLIAALVVIKGQGVADILPTLGLFGIAATRLMPAFSKIVSNMTLLRGNTAAVDILYDDLRTWVPEEPADDERHRRLAAPNSGLATELRLDQVSYRYPGSDALILDRVSLAIPVQRSLALVGATGSGKTTLVDVILGLLQPSHGRVLVDGRDVFAELEDWQHRIGYIPQDIYLIDDTLRRNIAFGVPDADIDEVRVKAAVHTAQLEDVVDALPTGLDTVIGERGTRLSGGQRQRIGIARALYNDPEILIMDEATSSVDSETESRITRAIDDLNGTKTVIVIAHRLSTVRHCDRIAFIDHGRVVDIGTFDELAERNRDFSRMIEMARVSSPAA